MSRSRVSTGPAAASSRSSPGRGRELAEPRAEDEPTLQVAADQAMVLQRGRQPVGRRPGQAGRLHQGRQAGRPGLQCAQHDGGLVQNADSATLVHAPILPSHRLRRKSRSVRWARTMAEKVWEAHVVRRAEGEPDLLYVDLHLVHEVTSPQAFDGLRLTGRPVRRPDLTLATEDHNVPTTDIDKPIAEPVSRLQIETLRQQLRRVRRHAAPASATSSRASCTSSARSWG